MDGCRPGIDERAEQNALALFSPGLPTGGYFVAGRRRILHQVAWKGRPDCNAQWLSATVHQSSSQWHLVAEETRRGMPLSLPCGDLAPQPTVSRTSASTPLTGESPTVCGARE